MSLRKGLSPASLLAVGVIIFASGFALLTYITFIRFSVETAGFLAMIVALVGALIIAYAFNILHREGVLSAIIGADARSSGLGLAEVSRDSTVYDYTDIIIEPHRLTVILNHGQTWTSVHRERLRKRFLDPTKETTIFLIHPKSPTIQMLAKKASVDPAQVVAKIEETLRIIEEIKTPGTNVDVYGHFLYNSYSACIGDESAVVTPYYISRGSRTVPVMQFIDRGPGSVFRGIVADADRLKLDSAPIEMPQQIEPETDKVINITKAG